MRLFIVRVQFIDGFHHSRMVLVYSNLRRSLVKSNPAQPVIYFGARTRAMPPCDREPTVSANTY